LTRPRAHLSRLKSPGVQAGAREVALTAEPVLRVVRTWRNMPVYAAGASVKPASATPVYLAIDQRSPQLEVRCRKDRGFRCSTPRHTASAKPSPTRDCGDTADVTPRSGVVRKDQRGNKPKVEPDRSTGVPEDAPAGSAAGGEHSGDGLYRGVLRIIQPPVRLSRRVRSANLAKQGDDSRHQQRDSGERGEDKWGPRHAGSPGWECPGVPPVRVSDKRHDGHGKDGSEQQIERQDDGGGNHGRR
jgi:hypothetical protein